MADNTRPVSCNIESFGTTSNNRQNNIAHHGSSDKTSSNTNGFYSRGRPRSNSNGSSSGGSGISSIHIGSSSTKASSINSSSNSRDPVRTSIYNNVLDNKHRFTQDNYECAFCSIEAETFQGMLKHIARDHPWYDLTVHQNIR